MAEPPVPGEASSCDYPAAQPEKPSLQPYGAGAGWRWHVILGAGALGVLILLLASTFRTMVETWSRFDSYTHGWVVVPVSVALIWRRRQVLSQLEPVTDFRAVALLITLGILWWAGARTELVVAQQVAATAMIPGLVWLMLGSAVTRSLAFPLGFLFFTVPVGHELVPILMGFTATFAVLALQWTGFEVVRDGLFIVLSPQLVFEVADACSGIRYLMVSVCLGTLFAHFLYRTWWRRAAMILLAVALPIVGNGLRAYLIIVLAYLTDGQLATDADHLVYGAVFFGLLMFLMGWIGKFWQESNADDPPLATPPARGRTRAEPRSRNAIALLAALACIAVGPTLAAMTTTGFPGSPAASLRLAHAANGWRAVPGPMWRWRPRSARAATELLQGFRSADQSVELYLAYSDERVQDAATLVPRQLQRKGVYRNWREFYSSERAVRIGDESVAVFETLLSSGQRDLLVWHWNRVGGANERGWFRVRWREIVERLLTGRGGGATVAVYTYVDWGAIGSTRETLSKFLADMWPQIEAAVESARHTPPIQVTEESAPRRLTQ